MVTSNSTRKICCEMKRGDIRVLTTARSPSSPCS